MSDDLRTVGNYKAVKIWRYGKEMLINMYVMW